MVRNDFWNLQHVTLEFVDVVRDLEISAEKLHPLGQAVVSLKGTGHFSASPCHSPFPNLLGTSSSELEFVVDIFKYGDIVGRATGSVHLLFFDNAARAPPATGI